MRFSMSIDGIHSRGTLALRAPLVWATWFTVDDHALRHLLGDTTAEPVVFAPGPQPADQAFAFTRTLSSATLPADRLRVGLALFYTEGGQNEKEALAKYQALKSQAHALALRQAAEAAGLSALLEAMGLGRPTDPALDERLAKGDSLEAFDELDLGATAGLFELGSTLAGLHAPKGQRTATLAASANPSAPVLAAAPVLASARLDRSLRVDRTLVRADLRPPSLSEGQVLASLVQTWRPAQVKEGASLDLRRSLPSPTALRASLSLSGLIRRDG